MEVSFADVFADTNQHRRSERGMLHWLAGKAMHNGHAAVRCRLAKRGDVTQLSVTVGTIDQLALDATLIDLRFRQQLCRRGLVQTAPLSALSLISVSVSWLRKFADNVEGCIMFDCGAKTALVTGAASGIGLASAELLAQSGATVALNHLPDDQRGQQQVERLQAKGLRVIAAPGDVSNAESAEQMVRRAIENLGRLDYLINNAGTPATTVPIALADLEKLTEEFWTTILSTNLVGPFRCVKAAAPALRKARGAVVSTASIAGFDVAGSSIAYNASKAGLVNVTKNLARALAPEVRVNAVAPGFVATGWTKSWPKERVDGAINRALLKRACTPDDIAQVIVFLCCGAAMVTGQTIIVDGGLSLG